MLFPIREIIPTVKNQNSPSSDPIREPFQHCADRLVQVAVDIGKSDWRIELFTPFRYGLMKPARVNCGVRRKLRDHAVKVKGKLLSPQTHRLRHASPAIERVISAIRKARPYEHRHGPGQDAKLGKIAFRRNEREQSLQHFIAAIVSWSAIRVPVQPLNGAGGRPSL